MLGKSLHKLIPEPATSARDDNQLGLPRSIPVKWCSSLRQAPVIEGEPRERLVDPSQDPDDEEIFKRAGQALDVHG